MEGKLYNMAQIIEHFIDGKRLSACSGATYDDINPASGEVIAEVSLSEISVADSAVNSASRAFQ